MGKEAYERKLREVEALRTAPDPEALKQLGRALKDRNNYLLAKAAAIVGERRLQDLIPDLLAAFDRMMQDPAKTDPKCWAKTAIAKALQDLEHDEPSAFLRGIVHVQQEAAYLRPEDTAVTLRGTCAMALIGCRLDNFEVLKQLTGLLADTETPARIDAARAIAQLGAREGALLLRLKAQLGDTEPEVIGHCLAALLSLAPVDSLPFVARFLRSSDEDIRTEAAGVLTESREPEALEILKEFLSRQIDPEVHRTVLTLLGTSPQPASGDYLVSVIESASERVAGYALTALGKSRFGAACQERARELVKARQSPALEMAFHAAYR